MKFLLKYTFPHCKTSVFLIDLTNYVRKELMKYFQHFYHLKLINEYDFTKKKKKKVNSQFNI